MAVEAGVGLVVVALLIGAELGAWRLLRGPAKPRAMLFRAGWAALVTLPLVAVGTWQLTKSRHFQFFGGMVTHVETAEPVLALTFDDGPMPGYAEEVLAILRAEGVKATFFVIGSALQEHMAEAQRITADGHQLGNHSFSHPQMVGVSYAFVQQEIERTDQLIRAAGYGGEILFRPPYSKRFVVLPYYLSQTQRTTIFMDVEPESYPDVGASAEKITQHVLERARPGSIILLHVMFPSGEETRKALPGIIHGLKDRGYRFATVSELLALGN